jgi:hypothetical protein
MEDKPPQRAGREAPRSRTPRAAFSTPEQPVPPSKPAERAPRRAAKAPPPVTFQSPNGEEDAAAGRKAAPRKAAPAQPARKAAASERNEPAKAPAAGPAKAEPAKAPAAGRATSEPAKAAKAGPATSEPAKAAKAGPAKSQPTKAGPAKSQPIKAANVEPGEEEAAKAVPGKEEAAKPEPVKPAAPVKAAKATPPKKAARKATKAPVKKAPPAQRRPAPSAAETETVSLPAEERTPAAVTPTRPPEIEPPAHAAPRAARIPQAAEPAPAGEAVPPVRVPGPAAPEVPRTEAWAKIVADPGHAPELLALAATQTIGPRAREWARRISADYPAATPDAVARLAVAQFTRAGGVSSVFAAVAGSYSPFALLGANAFTYAELILHVAAAYGQDPTDPRRAVELLVLTGVHPSAEDAEAALATARQPAYEEDARLTDAVTRLGRMAAAQAMAWTALKGLNRFFPGTAVLAAIITSRSGARTMGAKATNFYGRAGKAITSG